MYLYILTTENEQVETKISSGIIPFIISPERRKYLGINLTKNVQDLYDENCKVLMKEIRKELISLRDIPYFDRNTQYSKDINSPKLIYRPDNNQFLSKSHKNSLIDINKFIIKFIWKGSSSDSQSNFEKDKK